MKGGIIMGDIFDIFKEKNIDKAFQHLGLDFEKLFIKLSLKLKE